MPDCTIYVSHTNEETPAVDRLKGALTAAGYIIAKNTQTVPPGACLKPVLQASMERAFRFLACFSSSRGAPTAYEPFELALAIERMASLPKDPLWLIPVKLNECAIPPLAMGDDRLNELAAVDLSGDWERGIAQLLASLPARSVADVAPEPTSTAVPRVEARLDVGVDAVRGRRIEIVNVKGNGSSDQDARTALKVGSITSDDTVTIVNLDRKR